MSLYLLAHTHTMSQYAYLIFVYFNDEKPPLKFRFSEITRFVDLKSILENIYLDNQRFVNVYYRLISIDNEGKILFSKFELKKNEDLTIMCSTFHFNETKGPVKVDAKIVRSDEDYSKDVETSYLMIKYIPKKLPQNY